VSGGSGWVVRVLADGPAAGAFEAAIEDGADAVSSFETEPGGLWRIEAYCRDAPDMAALETRLDLAAAGIGVARPLLEIEELRDVDWVAENQASFPPLQVARFFIHGSHVIDRPPAGSIPLLVDAGAAFGTGEHATTKGCLLAIEWLARRRRRLARGAAGIGVAGPRVARRGWTRPHPSRPLPSAPTEAGPSSARRRPRPLDVGCGTGVLAMAMARRMGVPVLGTDIHADSVRVARRNAVINGLSPLAGRVGVRFAVANGVDHPVLAGRYDPIVANILAGPLCALAPSLKRRLRPGGRIVLSGLLGWQETRVLSAYRRVGLRLKLRIAIDGWHTLVMGR